MSMIKGYQLQEPWTTQNAGTCMWSFCEKSGREYFIKKFDQSYPTDESKLSAKLIERKRKICEDFYSEKKEFYDVLSCCRTGNNVIVQEFFRSGSKYYAVTERVYADGTDPSIVSRLTREKKETLIRSVLYSIARLHEVGIVHADIKPDNVLLKSTNDGFYTAKIIDFDASFLVEKEPAVIRGDDVYLAPEAVLKEKEKSAKVKLSEKIDIFALGILFHEYWTGERPQIGSDYRFVWEAVLDGSEIQLSNDIPLNLRTNISRMLSKDPAERPSAGEILQSFGAKEGPLPDFSEKVPSGFYRPDDMDG